METNMEQQQDWFLIYIDRILKHEGGYVNHPKDPGGETNWGITKNTARQYGYTGEMQHLSKSEAIRIYKRAFWIGQLPSEMAPPLAFQYLDATINHGQGNAAKMLQRAMQIKSDGIIGPITRAKALEADPITLAMKFNQQRIEFYLGLKTFPTFGKGWMRRVAVNLVYIDEDLFLSHYKNGR